MTRGREAFLKTGTVLALAGTGVIAGCTAPDSTPRPTPTSKNYATYLQEYCATGRTPIDIYVWNKDQQIPAGVYKDANGKECEEKGIQIRIVVSEENVTTGQIVNGRRVIRYYFPMLELPDSGDTPDPTPSPTGLPPELKV